MNFSKDTLDFHKKSLIIDLHADTLLLNRLFGYNLNRKHKSYLPTGIICFHGDVPRFRMGNLGAVFLGLVSKPFGINANHIDRMIDVAEETCRLNPQQCTMARTVEDILDAQRANKTAFLLGIEGATALDGDPRRVRIFAKRGVRYLGLVHLTPNFAAVPGVASGKKGVKSYKGLSKHGEMIIKECVRSGVVIDLAHISEGGFYRAIDCIPEKTPVIVSHGGVRKLKDTRRNLTDDQIRAVASTGGVIGLMNGTLCVDGRKMENYIQHFLAVRDIAGYKHVAIGSDLDGFIFPMRKLDDFSKLPVLTQFLLDAGVKKYEVSAILGENVLRVFKAVPPKYY